MKSIISFCFYLIFLTFLPTAYAEKGSTEKVCDAWRLNIKEAEFCSTQRTCGVGYSSIAKFERYSGDIYACGIANVGSINPTSNSNMCSEYFIHARRLIPTLYDEPIRNGIPRVRGKDAICSSDNCAPAFREVAKFYGGSGKNTRACIVKSMNDRKSCTDYCVGKSSCKCLPKKTCGSGYSRAELYGEWAACELTERGQGGDANKVECNAWCAENRGVCNMCSDKYNCGKGYKRVRTFKEQRPGKNWFACQKR